MQERTSDFGVSSVFGGSNVEHDETFVGLIEAKHEVLQLFGLDNVRTTEYAGETMHVQEAKNPNLKPAGSPSCSEIPFDALTQALSGLEPTMHSSVEKIIAEYGAITVEKDDDPCSL